MAKASGMTLAERALLKAKAILTPQEYKALHEAATGRRPILPHRSQADWVPVRRAWLDMASQQGLLAEPRGEEWNCLYQAARRWGCPAVKAAIEAWPTWRAQSAWADMLQTDIYTFVKHLVRVVEYLDAVKRRRQGTLSPDVRQLSELAPDDQEKARAHARETIAQLKAQLAYNPKE